jgi:hypothetical protein
MTTRANRAPKIAASTTPITIPAMAPPERDAPLEFETVPDCSAVEVGDVAVPERLLADWMWDWAVLVTACVSPGSGGVSKSDRSEDCQRMWMISASVDFLVESMV